MGRIAQELIGRILFVDRISLSISGWGYWFAKVCWANCKTTTASQSCGHRAGQWKSPCNWSVASRGLWPEKLVWAASSDVVVEGVSSHLASFFVGKSCLYKCGMQSIPLLCIIHIHICTYRLYIYTNISLRSPSTILQSWFTNHPYFIPEGFLIIWWLDFQDIWRYTSNLIRLLTLQRQ